MSGPGLPALAGYVLLAGLLLVVAGYGGAVGIVVAALALAAVVLLAIRWS
jgi:hypothetical protein